jgi:hypothetical protein
VSDLGKYSGETAQLVGPIANIIPGGQAIVAMAELGVKIFGGGDDEPKYYRPFYDPSIAKPYGMFARPAALTLHPASKKQPSGLALAGVQKRPDRVYAVAVPGTELGSFYHPFAFKYYGVAKGELPAHWSTPLWTHTATEAKTPNTLATTQGVGARTSQLQNVPDPLSIYGPKFPHPQCVGPTPSQSGYTSDISQIWTELALIRVAYRLVSEGEDPAWAFWLQRDAYGKEYALDIQQLQSVKGSQTRTVGAADFRKDPFLDQLIDFQWRGGDSLAGTPLAQGIEITKAMAAKVDAYQIEERETLAKLDAFHTDVQDFAQQVVDAYNAGTISKDDFDNFVHQATGTAGALIPPSDASTPFAQSPSGFPLSVATKTGSVPIIWLAAAAVAAFFMLRHE